MSIKTEHQQLLEQFAAMISQQTAQINYLYSTTIKLEFQFISNQLEEIRKIMSTQGNTLADVQASLTALTTAQAAIGADVTAAVADITALGQQIAALQAAGGATPADLAGLKTTIDGITAGLNTSATQLTGALPAPPAPTA